MNVLRRLPLTRLLLLCGGVLVAGISITAIALALGTGSTPPAKPLAQAVHDALGGPSVAGFSADVKFTDNLLEGASLASGATGDESGGLASSPLVSGASGRIWVAADGRTRLELQSEKGDTEIIYDGHTLELYDASSNTLYRLNADETGKFGVIHSATGQQPHVFGSASSRPAKLDSAQIKRARAMLRRWHAEHPHGSGTAQLGVAQPEVQMSGGDTDTHGPPSVADIEKGIAKVREHAKLSEATPTDVGGQPAYTVRISPKEGGSLIGGAELSFDADNGLPLRTAIYSSTSSSPVIELASSNVSLGAVNDSVFEFTPPPGAKIVNVDPSKLAKPRPHADAGTKPKVTTHGKGLASIAVIEAKAKKGAESGKSLEGLPKVKINGVEASELQTELGTLLSFERSGVHYLILGAVPASTIEALARGL